MNIKTVKHTSITSVAIAVSLALALAASVQTHRRKSLVSFGCFGKGLVIQKQLRLGLFLGISSGLMFSTTVALTRVGLTLTFKEE